MIKPARGYVLIQAEEADEVSAGGVFLPDRVKDMPQKGKVLAVGDWNTSINYDATKDVNIGIPIASITEAQLVYPPCKVGDTVIFKRFVDNRIKEEGKELLLVKFEDILGVYGS